MVVAAALTSMLEKWPEFLLKAVQSCRWWMVMLADSSIVIANKVRDEHTFDALFPRMEDR